MIAALIDWPRALSTLCRSGGVPKEADRLESTGFQLGAGSGTTYFSSPLRYDGIHFSRLRTGSRQNWTFIRLHFHRIQGFVLTHRNFAKRTPHHTLLVRDMRRRRHNPSFLPGSLKRHQAASRSQMGIRANER
jgi:hypothetical protein